MYRYYDLIKAIVRKGLALRFGRVKKPLLIMAGTQSESKLRVPDRLYRPVKPIVCPSRSVTVIATVPAVRVNKAASTSQKETEHISIGVILRAPTTNTEMYSSSVLVYLYHDMVVNKLGKIPREAVSPNVYLVRVKRLTVLGITRCGHTLLRILCDTPLN